MKKNIYTNMEQYAVLDSGLQVKAEEVFVIGDTPQDIIHARKAGAKVVAVATGGHSFEELAQHSPDLLVNSLEPIGTILNFLGANG